MSDVKPGMQYSCTRWYLCTCVLVAYPSKLLARRQFRQTITERALVCMACGPLLTSGGSWQAPENGKWSWWLHDLVLCKDLKLTLMGRTSLLLRNGTEQSDWWSQGTMRSLIVVRGQKTAWSSRHNTSWASVDTCGHLLVCFASRDLGVPCHLEQKLTSSSLQDSYRQRMKVGRQQVRFGSLLDENLITRPKPWLNVRDKTLLLVLLTALYSPCGEQQATRMMSFRDQG